MISVHFHASRVFEDIQQYLDFLFEMKKNSPLIGVDDCGHIDELMQHTECVLTNLLSNLNASTLLRRVLVHRDLNDMNILVDKSGAITGVVNWEYQVLHPAVLAASYPPWLSYDGCNDPRFVDPKQTFWSMNTVLTSPALVWFRGLCTTLLQKRHWRYFSLFAPCSQPQSRTPLLHRRRQRRHPNGRPSARRKRIAANENYYFRVLPAGKAQKLITVPHPGQHRHQGCIALEYPTTALSKAAHYRIRRDNTQHITRLGNHFHAPQTKISWKRRCGTTTTSTASHNQLSNGSRSARDGHLRQSSISSCQQQQQRYWCH